MKYLPGIVEFGLLVLLMGLAWAWIEADRDNPPELLPVQQADLLVQQAAQAHAKGDIAQASRLYWYAIKLDDQQVEARVSLASIYQSRLHSWENDALKLVDDALRYDPSNTQAHLIRGQILRNRGEVDLAMEEYLQVLQNEPTNPEAHYQLGTAYEGSQRLDDAQYHYEQAIAGDPALKQPEFENQPFGLTARLQLARLLQRQQKPERAIQVLEEALSLRQDYTEVKSELVSILQRRASILIREQADAGTQLANYQKILAVDPEEPEAWLRVGELYEHYLGQPQKALECYKRAYELDPLYNDALLNIRSIELQTEGKARLTEQ